MTILTLQNFVFGHLEIPSSINFGGDQLIKRHILAGGARVIDAMGVNPDDVKWSGYFDGTDAVFRARYLQTLMNYGKPVTCTYGQFSYQVLIESFRCNFQAMPLPYSISLVVIIDNTYPISIIAPLGFDDAIIADIVQALQIAEILADGNIIDQVAALYAAASALGSIVTATQAQINNLEGLTNSSLSATNSYITPVQTNLFGNNFNNISLLGSSSNFQTTLSLDQQAVAMNNLVLAYSIQAYLERELRNLQSIAASSITQSLPFVNANLYNLAVQYYQDWTLWELIRDANNLNDFIVPGISFLIIPPNPNQNVNSNTTVNVNSNITFGSSL